MSLATANRAGHVVLRSTTAGRVRFHPPASLCGELEVYDEGETIADVDGTERIAAPAFGFVLRSLVADGAFVEDGSSVLVFSIVGAGIRP